MFRMQRGQKIAFTTAVLFGATICAAVALGEFTPPPEPVFTPQPTAGPLVASTTNWLNFTSTQPVVIYTGIEFEGSPFEQAEARPAHYSRHLLDTTSPLPEIAPE
jgi:hypothetical protein